MELGVRSAPRASLARSDVEVLYGCWVTTQGTAPGLQLPFGEVGARGQWGGIPIDEHRSWVQDAA